MPLRRGDVAQLRHTASADISRKHVDNDIAPPAQGTLVSNDMALSKSHLDEIDLARLQYNRNSIRLAKEIDMINRFLVRNRVSPKNHGLP